MIAASPRSAPGSRPRGCASGAPSPLINLLSDTLRLRSIQRSRTRFWGALVTIAAVALACGWLAATHLTTESRSVTRMLTEARGRLAAEKKKTIELAARSDLLRRRQAALDSMRAPEQWSRRLAELADAMPDMCVLTQIQVDRVAAPPPGARPSPTAGATAAAGGLAAAPPRSSDVKLSGLANDHAALAQVIRRLRETAGYQQVQLVRSSAAAAGSSAMLEFGITCRR